MKKNGFALMILIMSTLVLLSCQKEEYLDKTEADLNTEGNGKIGRAGINTQLDWEGRRTINLGGIAGEVTLPWYTASNTSIPDFILDDYRKADGWVLLYNYCESPIDTEQDYIIFYNIFTGTLRSYFYSNRNTSGGNSGFWLLSISGAENSLLNNNRGSYPEPMDSRVLNPLVLTNNITRDPYNSALKLGWNCFEAEFTYDPNAAANSLTMSIAAHNANIQQVNISGSFSSKSEGTIVTFNTTNPLDGAGNGVSKAAGNAAQNALENMFKSNNGDIPTKGSIAGAAVAALVAAGVNAIFKAFTAKFDKETQTIQRLEFATEGTLKVDGTISTTTNANIVSLSKLPVPGTVISNGTPADSYPFYNKPLGVWNISNAPVILVPEKCYSLEWEPPVFYYNKYYLVKDGSFNVILNPEVLSNISKYTVRTEIICRTESSDMTIMGIVLYNDGKEKFLRYPSSYFAAGTPVNWNPNLNPWEELETPYIFDRHCHSGLLVNVTVTLYPKAPFNEGEVVISRTYKPNFEYVTEF